MEFNEKLQQLRKQKGLTQEELAEVLCVSRAAVSKWESARGYPNIDSLKDIAKFFSVTVDELLSGEELITLARQEQRLKEEGLRERIFGMLDLSVSVFLFLPFFARRTEGAVEAVSLLSLTTSADCIKLCYIALVIATAMWGAAELVLRRKSRILEKDKGKISLVLNAVGVIVFAVSLQPYATVFLFVFLMLKLLMLDQKK